MKLVPCLFVAACAAERVSRARVAPLPERLRAGGPSSTEVTLETLDVALVSTDLDGLEREIQVRADPHSPLYAQWLSTEEVTGYVRASDEAIDIVSAWMREAGLEPKLNNHRDYLTAHNVSSSAVEKLLGAALHDHYDAETGKTAHLIPGRYSLPTEVAPHVSKVFPVHSVPLSHIRARIAGYGAQDLMSGSWPSDCSDLSTRGIITPAVTRSLYNYTTEGGSSQSSIAALLPPKIGVDHSAVAYIQKNCGLPEHAFDAFVGKNHESDCSKKKPSEDECYEAAMDSQIIGTTAIGCRTEFWSPGGSSFIGMFKFINDKGDAAPRVFSMSFGDVETERDDDTQNTEKEFAKIVAKGITMVASSGDNGANQRGLTKKTYKTNYPASSKYVLSVGGTSLKKLGKMQSGEVAVKDGYSSGGFSGLWAAPSWQGAATQAYLKSGAEMPSSGFDATGRGVPDISALSGGDVEAWQVRIGGRWEGTAGTSTSAPFVASLIAKLNAKRLAAGLGTMGFLNPWLYSAVKTSGALFDVTEGYNSAKGQGGAGVFHCAKGWDPVTGLGTPNYEVLERLALSGAAFVV